MKETQKEELKVLAIKTLMFTLSTSTVLVAGMFGYSKFISEDSPFKNTEVFTEVTEEEKEMVQEEAESEEEILHRNIAVFGTDAGGTRTDVIFVVNFNSETKEINVVNVPRDTKVDWSAEQRENMVDLGKSAPWTTKINEMTAYSGMDNIRESTINELETMFEIEIDNYIIVSLDAFRQIVDAIGGVDMYVPQDMYYQDSYQGLYINL